MSPYKDNLCSVTDALIAATNAYGVERVLALFTSDAVMNDPSTGHRFDGHAGIQKYTDPYFIGYQMVTRYLTVKRLGHNRAGVRVDFPGTSGHEWFAGDVPQRRWPIRLY